MKRPPVVIASILLFGLFVILGSMSAAKLLPIGLGKFVAASIIPILFLVAFLGVLFRKRWARLFGVAIILINALIMVLISVSLASGSGSDITPGQAMFVSVIFVLELWWAYRLGLGEASKEYFQGSVNV